MIFFVYLFFVFLTNLIKCRPKYPSVKQFLNLDKLAQLYQVLCKFILQCTFFRVWRLINEDTALSC